MFDQPPVHEVSRNYTEKEIMSTHHKRDVGKVKLVNRLVILKDYHVRSVYHMIRCPRENQVIAIDRV